MAKEIVCTLLVPDSAGAVTLLNGTQATAATRRTIVTNLLALTGCDVSSTRLVGFTADALDGTSAEFSLPTA
jgi:hypothetical protein